MVCQIPLLSTFIIYKKTWITLTAIQAHIDYFTSLNPSFKILFLDSSKL